MNTSMDESWEEYIRCTVCEAGSIDEAAELASIACNVRQFRSESFTVWRCSACGSLHCKEPIDFDRYYDRYPLDDQELKFFTRRAYCNRIRILRRAGLKKRDTVLDYGCGGGLFLNFLKERGHLNAVGYDPYSSDFRTAPPSGTKFDFVYSFGVIEHVPCPRAFLHQHRRLLEDDGTVIVATPDAGGLDLADPDVVLMHQPYHRHILSIDGITKLAEREGLALVRVEKLNWMDTRFPGMNGRFVADYVKATGGLIDSLFEPRQVRLFLTSPNLWLSFWFGHLYPTTGYMICMFRRATA